MANLLVDSAGAIAAALLVQLGEATDPPANGAWPVYFDNEPSDPDNCITAYSTVGRLLGRFYDGSLLDDSGFQVRVRAINATVGWTKVDAVRVALSTVKRAQVNVSGGGKYLVWCVDNISQIKDIGSDSPKTRRRLFTVDAMLTVKTM